MQKIFGTDGIRGTANEGMLTIRFLEKLVPAIIDKFLPKKIVLAKDTRISGDMLLYGMAAIFNSYGVDVSLIGIAPTPAVAYITKTLGFDLGIVISASHNPYQDNGIKIFNKNGNKLSAKDEAIISDIINHTSAVSATHDRIGATENSPSLVDSYKDYIVSNFENLDLSDLNIVVDCANGALSYIAQDIFSKFNGETSYVANEPNGMNINDNCGVMYPNNLSKEVRKRKADIGIAFDGDGDRVSICDENGDIIDGDHLLGFLASKLSNVKSVAITDTSNIALDKFLSSLGIATIRTDIGDKYIASEINAGNASFGGEKSGHIIISPQFKTGDGVLSALTALNFLQRIKKPASEALRLFDLYPSLHKNVAVQDKNVIDNDEIKKFIQKAAAESTCRVLVRKSGTEKVVRILVEGSDSEVVKNVAADIEKEILSYAR